MYTTHEHVMLNSDTMVIEVIIVNSLFYIMVRGVSHANEPMHDFNIKKNTTGKRSDV